MTCRSTVDCWCLLCHRNRYLRLKQPQHSLLRLITKFELHPERESVALEHVFAEVLDTAAYAKLIRMEIERTTRYKYVKPYLRWACPEMSDTERDKLSGAINHASWVYDHIDRIYANLVQVGDQLDIRRLSLNNLYSARDLGWCFSQADKNRGTKKKPDEPVYTEENFQKLMEKIFDDTCTKAVIDNPKLAASFTNRIQRLVMKRATRHIQD